MGGHPVGRYAVGDSELVGRDNVKTRVATLAAGQLGLAGVLDALGVLAGLVPSPRPVVFPVALAFAVVGSLQVHVELRRHACAVTVVEAVLVASLLHLRASEVVIAAVLGEGLACVKQRQSGRQLGFNLTGMLLASSVAALSFASLPTRGPGDPVTWASALLAVACFALVGQASTVAVLAIVEGRRFEHVLLSSLSPAAVAAAVSATVGLLSAVLATVSPAALLLAAPLVLFTMAETRRVAEHRADHLRFKRLYAASSRTIGLASETEALSTLAAEARSLVTGTVAIICTSTGDGRWYGMVVDDEGHRPAAAGEVDAILGLTGSGGTEVTIDRVPTLASLAPGLESVVVASAEPGAAAPIALGVLRHLPSDEAARTRGEVLRAFMGHAALTVANARLYADVETALAHQLDLNRQKDEFVATMSHELRTPLTGMIGALSMMRRFGDRMDAGRCRDLVELGLRQGSRLQQLIEDLLLLSQGAAEGGLEPPASIDLGELVQDIAADLTGRSGLPGGLIALGPGSVPQICADPVRVRQVLRSLVENACKFAPGSPVEIVANAAENGGVKIDVIDYGPGIRDEDKARVFERFVQLDGSATRSQGGTGIGLYICRELVNAMHGTLELTDASGGGCCFTLTLPTRGFTAHPESMGGFVLVGAASQGGGA